uniref:Putative secreted protein n=1 Tax=Anopheles marajoara TaxID=58244 RepID=A0A2M4CF82_9DIPT
MFVLHGGLTVGSLSATVATADVSIALELVGWSFAWSPATTPADDSHSAPATDDITGVVCTFFDSRST